MSRHIEIPRLSPCRKPITENVMTDAVKALAEMKSMEAERKRTCIAEVEEIPFGYRTVYRKQENDE